MYGAGCFKSKPAADHEARQDQLLFLSCSWLCLAQFDFTAMPIPPCFLTKCKVYSECQKCRKTLKSTRGERSHLQQCCFNDFDQGNRLTGQENAAPESCSSGSNRAHSQCATSVASNSCVGAVQSVQQGRDPDAVLQLEVTGGHVSISELQLQSSYDNLMLHSVSTALLHMPNRVLLLGYIALPAVGIQVSNRR